MGETIRTVVASRCDRGGFDGVGQCRLGYSPYDHRMCEAARSGLAWFLMLIHRHRWLCLWCCAVTGAFGFGVALYLHGLSVRDAIERIVGGM